MLQGIFGNASEVDVRSVQAELDAILVQEEKITRALKSFEICLFLQIDA
jgi:hypothetical protein